MTDTHLNRFFILGAGFSAPAGLPTADALLNLVLREVDAFSPGAGGSHLRNSLTEYLEYEQKTAGAVPNPVDIEKFAAYLDYAHYLGLRGSDTWSEDGNEDQLQLRWGIGRVLHRLTPDRLPELYIEFAERLKPGDVLFTFNYDLIAERALEAVGLPFRRFPNRFDSLTYTGGVIDSETESAEVLIAKPHGSIDWVSRQSFDEVYILDDEELQQSVEESRDRRDIVFGRNPITRTRQLLEGVQQPDDPMRHIYEILDLDAFYQTFSLATSHSPVIMAPSEAKQLYGHMLRGLWNGMPRLGSLWGGLGIIGYSLPDGDPYAKQALYELARGYTYALENPDWRFGDMAKIALIDKRDTPDRVDDLRDRYRFLSEAFTEFRMEGFSMDALNVLFPSTLPFPRLSD